MNEQKQTNKPRVYNMHIYISTAVGGNLKSLWI